MAGYTAMAVSLFVRAEAEARDQTVYLYQYTTEEGNGVDERVRGKEWWEHGGGS